MISTREHTEKAICLNKNIVLIGMPGCGKTTIGRAAAVRLSLTFTDTDEYIEKSEGKSIPEIFLKGEEVFRSKETAALLEVVKKVPQVISTGGGVVTKPENMEILSRDSVIIFINRPVENILSDIDEKSRPLIREDINKIYSLYKERLPLYKLYCHYELENIKGIEDCVRDIVKIYNGEGTF